ncbi:MAG: hypothetical protein K9I97_01340 [Cryomorphaceae bacterium]|nr:hypothetical protein [Cryomorphaceae bacterium]
MKFIRKYLKPVSAFIGLNLLVEIFWPLKVYALTNGPSQPEVQSFQPIGVTDMVNPFSGDFSYNIPLIDVDGYPVNLAYNSGITSDQEASWVGLGWNINVGAINRSMRGIPDEFNGDIVETEYNLRPNRTVGASTIIPFTKSEIFGNDVKDDTTSKFSIGVNYNNYNGFGFETMISPSFNAGNSSKGYMNATLGLSSSSDGLTVRPNLSFDNKKEKNEKADQNRSPLSVGSSFNSRSGLTDLTISSSVNINQSGRALKFGYQINFGLPTYTPRVNMPMRNYNVNFSYATGNSSLGIFPKGTSIKGYYSEQAMNLDSGMMRIPAFGFLNSQNVTRDDNGRVSGMMDLNRSWDIAYNKNTPNLPITNYTFDIYSASGQGISGSFRPFRNDIGYVADNVNRSISAGTSVGAEAGAGNLFETGVDFSVNTTETESGEWASTINSKKGSAANYSNRAAAVLPWRSLGDDLTYESSSFKEMGELSVDDESDFYQSIGKDQAVRIGLDANGPRDFEVRTKAVYQTVSGAEIAMPTKNYRTKRIKRNQTFSLLSFRDLPYKGLNGNTKPLYHAPKHHVGEISVTRNDGVRYYYGVPAYNTYQEETSFNVGMNTDNLSRAENISGHKANIEGDKGIVNYAYDNSNGKGDNSIYNRRGNDHYYSSTKMPAFAYSHLLSAVLSPDYVDVDGVRGPSKGDIGNYTLFKYQKSKDPYKWRTPFGNGTANYNEGLRTDYFDDKANYVYGEKEIWYLEKIETKNTVAIFTLEDRNDACESAGRNGGFGKQNMKLLRKISVYSKPEYDANPQTAVPIKEVHFVYGYSLCPKTENNVEMKKDQNSSGFDLSKSGKLTLKKIYFTYGTSNKSAFSPYTFDYTNLIQSNFNPEYGLKNHDRWGNYKQNKGDILNVQNAYMANSDFPYVDQIKAEADLNATAWTLSKINLPSGGSIRIHCESDDYAYVQNMKAMQMFTITGIANDENDDNEIFSGGSKLFEPNYISTKNNRVLVFKLQESLASSTTLDQFKNKYLDGVTELYFKFLVDITGKGHYEYVSGYADIDTFGMKSSGSAGADYDYGWIKLKEVNQGDAESTVNVNPISKAAWHFARVNAPQMVYNHEYPETPGVQKFVSRISDASLLKSVIKTVMGANGYLKDLGCGKDVINSKSFVRLLNPNRKKLGGGLRVHKIEMSDEWDAMNSASGNSTQIYGQEYSYTTKDPGTGETISSGVAAWEPSIGSDENPFYLPIWYGNKQEKLLIPDDKSYLNGPIGEAYFPSPSVGYSKVTVKNLSGTNVKRHATGKVVNEYYTARDFPTITGNTAIDAKPRKTSPLFRFFKIDNRDYMTVSQGYVVELNDMHGKQKAMWVYPEDDDQPISGVEYKYQCEAFGKDSWKLNNDALVVHPDGTTDTSQIGVEFDFVADFREQKTTIISGGLKSNLNSFLAAYIPVPVPTVFPSIEQEYTRFRSAVTTKIINRFGILQETIAHDLGSKVSTKNLAYDSETGLVLLTQTKNNFEDDIYSFNYPAHWYYDNMGQAYKNLGLKFYGVQFNTNGSATIANADKYFVEGDELVADNKDLAWVKSVNGNTVTFMNEMGNPFKPAGSVISMIIVRSGRRNLIGVSMGGITSLENPLTGLQSNKFNKVINTSAQVFKDQWKTYCECFAAEGSFMKKSQNQFAIGNKGHWRAYKSYAYLIDRQHSWKNNNTDIRRDGVYTAFNPYWKWYGNKWVTDNTNWTWTSEITEINPYGAELENVDALGRFSSATYGYNNTIPTSVAANAKYREIAFDGFEDYDFQNCATDHFSYKADSLSVSKAMSHTGKKSLSVGAGTPKSVTRNLNDCIPE